MKKKIGLLVTAGAISALLVVGSTLAWFTDDKEATNTFTMGEVEIDLLENDGEVTHRVGTNGFAGLTLENVVPGDTRDKEVTVENAGTVDSYVRIKLTTALDALEGNVIPAKATTTLNETKIENLLKYNDVTDYNKTNWTLIDGYYYYNVKLAAQGVTPALFTDVTIPTSWGNEMANLDFGINVKVEAIQADNIMTGTFSVEALAAAWTSAVAQ